MVRVVRRESARPQGRTQGPSPLHHAVRAALNGTGEPMKLADLAAKVKAGGYATKSAHFPVILGLRLSEMPDVKRVERGVYAMT